MGASNKFRGRFSRVSRPQPSFFEEGEEEKANTEEQVLLARGLLRSLLIPWTRTVDDDEQALAQGDEGDADELAQGGEGEEGDAEELALEGNVKKETLRLVLATGEKFLIRGEEGDEGDKEELARGDVDKDEQLRLFRLLQEYVHRPSENLRCSTLPEAAVRCSTLPSFYRPVPVWKNLALPEPEAMAAASLEAAAPLELEAAAPSKPGVSPKLAQRSTARKPAPPAYPPPGQVKTKGIKPTPKAFPKAFPLMMPQAKKFSAEKQKGQKRKADEELPPWRKGNAPKVQKTLSTAVYTWDSESDSEEPADKVARFAAQETEAVRQAIEDTVASTASSSTGTTADVLQALKQSHPKIYQSLAAASGSGSSWSGWTPGWS